MRETTHRAPGETFAGHTQLEVKVCGSCGVMFAIPQALEEECDRNHSRYWWCPNGHSRHYVGETDAAKQARLRKLAEDRESVQRAYRDQAEASARGQKAAATRARNERDKDRRRVANGVCPCCGRTFKQVERHMKSQHPDYVAEAKA